MCTPALVVAGALGGLGIGANARMQGKTLKAQSAANKKAEQAANAAAQKSEEATNRALAKTPDSMALRSANERQAKGGIAGTMLTGAQGVPSSNLLLGRTTLLGQ